MKKAITGCRRRPRNGYATAQFNIGSEYLYNPKIKDSDKALFWFKKAADNGSQSAKHNLEIMIK